MGQGPGAVRDDPGGGTLGRGSARGGPGRRGGEREGDGQYGERDERGAEEARGAIHEDFLFTGRIS